MSTAAPGHLSTQQVAAILGRDTQAVRRLIWSGRLPCAWRVKQRGQVKYRISVEELRAYVLTYEPAATARLPATESVQSVQRRSSTSAH